MQRQQIKKVYESKIKEERERTNSYWRRDREEAKKLEREQNPRLWNLL